MTATTPLCLQVQTEMKEVLEEHREFELKTRHLSTPVLFVLGGIMVGLGIYAFYSGAVGFTDTTKLLLELTKYSLPVMGGTLLALGFVGLCLKMVNACLQHQKDSAAYKNWVDEVASTDT